MSLLYLRAARLWFQALFATFWTYRLQLSCYAHAIKFPIQSLLSMVNVTKIWFILPSRFGVTWQLTEAASCSLDSKITQSRSQFHPMIIRLSHFECKSFVRKETENNIYIYIAKSNLTLIYYLALVFMRVRASVRRLEIQN